MNNEQKEKFVALQKAFGVTPYVKPNIEYVDDPKRLYSNHPYKLTLPLHKTDYDGLLSNDEVKKNDRYELYMMHNKWSMREVLGPSAEGSTLTKEQVIEVLRMADAIIRSGRWDKSQIRAIFEIITDIYVGVELREMKDKDNPDRQPNLLSNVTVSREGSQAVTDEEWQQENETQPFALWGPPGSDGEFGMDEVHKIEYSATRTVDG